MAKPIVSYTDTAQGMWLSLRLYTYLELTELLKSCGFGDFRAYDTLTGAPFELGASHLGIVAHKQA